MSSIDLLLSDPRVVTALISLIVAATSLARAETARIDAEHAIKRVGGRRQTPPASPNKAPGGVERRKAQ